ncbi:MAG: TMEM165/GDT1 family protein [Nitrospirota bacterium]
MTAFIASLVFVVLAEMGDKTQLLAMAFACRFRWQTVMWGVFVATAANHLMAAALGSYLATVVPMEYIKIAAAVSFIGFGLWTIRGDTLEGEDRKYSFSPFWTVTVAFFIAEMGDKTQLATIALAVQYNAIITVWMGTTIGMLISNAIGIVFGMVMGKHIPERLIKWVAALIFIAFGWAGLYESLPKSFWSPAVTAGSAALTLTVIYLVARFTERKGSYVPVCEPGDKPSSSPETK